MRKLLVPFDGSESALRALQHAVKLAKQAPPTALHVVHAHEEPLLYGEIAVYVPKEKMADLQRKHSDDLLGAAVALLKNSGVAYETEILVGPIGEAIANRADALGCEGIVLGTRGLSAIGNLVMGSVATKIIHLAKVPVTLVK
jgi:nucleotide-binding universal stress UspA family protein